MSSNTPCKELILALAVCAPLGCTGSHKSAPRVTPRVVVQVEPAVAKFRSDALHENPTDTPPAQPPEQEAGVVSDESASKEESKPELAPTLGAPRPQSGKGWFCFPWLDHKRWGQNCYRSARACAGQRQKWTHGNTTACIPHTPAFCVSTRHEEQSETHCFGAPEYCRDHQWFAHYAQREYSECAEFE